jgi:hypothetical protein
VSTTKPENVPLCLNLKTARPSSLQPGEVFMSAHQHPSRRTKQSDPPESETVAKWRSLLQGLDAKSSFVNHTTRDRKQSLLKMREEIAKIARREVRFLCNCAQITVAESWFWEKFAAEMNIPCPIHGPCRLGIILTVMGYPGDGDPHDRRLEELLREYSRRCATYREQEIKDDES